MIDLNHWKRMVAVAPDKARAFDECLSEGAKCVRARQLSNATFGALFTTIAQDHDLLDGLGGIDALQEKLAKAIETKPNGNGHAGVDWEKHDRASGQDVYSARWPVIDPAAFYGLAGDLVKTIEPHSEADPIALLLQFLTMAGNVIGHEPYYQVESDRHHANLNITLVGESAKGRKGTSLGRVRAVVKVADQNWADDRLKGGLSSGEGLINEVRDPVRRWNAQAEAFETADPGVDDKRLMVVEAELAGMLSVMERPGNNLSPQVRRAWDGDKLTVLTKNSPLCATGSHISIIGHITVDELRTRLTRTDIANGFANRFLFACIKRSKKLPFGGTMSDSEVQMLGECLGDVISRVRTFGRMLLTAAAAEKWAEVYGDLSEGKPGLLGAVTARAEAQTIRLALIYALLDGHHEVDEPHLRAALAVWKYCEASAAYIFGDALGDSLADDILQKLRQAAAQGLTRTEIRDAFDRNKPAAQINAALQLLLTNGRARVERRSSGAAGGRPSEHWFANIETAH